MAIAIDSSIMRLPTSWARLSRISTISTSRKPMRRPSLLGALAVALGQLALRAVLQPADGGDHHAIGQEHRLGNGVGDEEDGLALLGWRPPSRPRRAAARGSSRRGSWRRARRRARPSGGSVDPGSTRDTAKRAAACRPRARPAISRRTRPGRSSAGAPARARDSRRAGGRPGSRQQDVVQEPAPAEQHRRLEHHAHGGDRRDHRARPPPGEARGGGPEARDHAEKGGFPAARGADEGHQLAAAHAERDAAHASTGPLVEA